MIASPSLLVCKSRGLSTTICLSILICFVCLPMTASGHVLYMWGSNQYGQLAGSPTEDLTDSPVPAKRVQAASMPQIKQLALGGGHTLALGIDGTIWSWGWNAKGQLGRGDPATLPLCPEPTQLTKVVPMAFIAAGHEQSMALDNDGKLWSICTTPRRLWQSSSFMHCDGGVRHAAAVTSDGKCLCWGRHGLKVCGGVGDVGVGQGGASTQAIQCGIDETSAGCENAVLWWPTDGAKLIKVACGWRHSAAVDDQGRVWTFGCSNKHGQLGRRRVECIDGEPAPVQDVDGAVHLSAGWSHTLVQLRDGRILTFGRGDKGQLGRRVDQGRGHDSTAGSVRMTEGYQACHGQPGAAWLGGTAGSEQILLVSTDGDLWASGWNEHGSETPKGPDLRVRNLGLGSDLGVEDCLDRHVLERLDLAGAVVIAAGGAHCACIAV